MNDVIVYIARPKSHHFYLSYYTVGIEITRYLSAVSTTAVLFLFLSSSGFMAITTATTAPASAC